MKAITALRQLNAYGLLNQTEMNSIQRKLFAKFGEYLLPLRHRKFTQVASSSQKSFSAEEYTGIYCSTVKP